MKKTMHTLSALTIAAALALFTTACSNEDLFGEKQQSQAPVAEAPVCHFNIPANIGEGTETRAITIGETSITSEFANTDKVYVFIEGQGANAGKLAVAHNGTDASTYLTPSNINGTTCTLEGALKFYYNDNYSFAPYEPAVNDVVYLYYNMNDPVEDAPSIEMAGLDYNTQNGSKDQDVYGSYGPYTFLASTGASACDFAEAKMKVTAVTGNGTDGYSLTMVQYDDNTKSNVHFENMGSIFRQRLAFTDKNSQPIAIPTLEKLSISFDGGDYVVGGYYPFSSYTNYYSRSELPITNPIVSAEGDVYLALMFYDSNKNLPLVLKATDTDGNVYSVTKNAPTGGFKNGKYYYGSATLAWQKCIKPTVTGTSATATYGTYKIPENPVNLTISGYSEGYDFELSEGHGGTITLDNVTASGTTNSPLYSPFIEQETNNNADVSLVLTGTNSITCGTYWCILVYGNLKLSCTGTSATLTVTGTTDVCCGISGYNYRSDGDFGVSFNECHTTTELDVTSMLAADGYSVIRSARTDNSDGTYTWTYTVRKN